MMVGMMMMMAICCEVGEQSCGSRARCVETTEGDGQTGRFVSSSVSETVYTSAAYTLLI